MGAALVVVGLDRRASFGRAQRQGFVAVLLVLLALFGARCADAAVDNVREVHEFDFVGFWLHGQSASEGLDFYDPRNAQRFAEDLELSPVFRLEIVDAGFWYPPPSAFLFAPLGWIDDVQDALAVWLAAMAAVLAVAVWLLWQRFLRPHGATGLLASAVLVLGAQATANTFSLGQTNFVALVALLAFWGSRDRATSGVWAGLAVLVKPFLAVLVVHQLVHRRWGAITAAAAAGVVASALSIVAFGWDTFTSFFLDDQVAAKPDFVYTEDANQSLLSMILRVTDTDFAGRSPLTTPLFVVAAAVLGAVTAWLTIRRRACDPELALGLWLLLALLLYPSSLGHYSLLLVPVLLLLRQRQAVVPGGVWGVAALAAGTYLVTSARGGVHTTLVYLGLWAVVAVLLARADEREPVLSPA